MKKALIILVILMCCSLAVFAAKYKVNTGGKVTTPTGTVQQSATTLTPQNLYNNYNAQTYVNNQQVLANSISTINIVMDYSGSMAYWISAAKRSMSAIVNQLPTYTKVGFRAFGYDRNGLNPPNSNLQKVKSIAKSTGGKYKVTTVTESYLGDVSGSCSSTAQIVPVMQYNASSLLKGMNSVNVGGSTPLTLALQQSVKSDFAGMDTTSPKKIVLITDGGENCGGDPCAFARQLVSARKDVIIDVVLISSNSNELRCLADTTGGKFYHTNDISSFTNVLNESIHNAPASTTTPVQTPTQQYEFIGE